MEISLRKANVIQASINEILKAQNFVDSILINEFQDPQTEINRTNGELQEQINRRRDLLDSLYDIRMLVSISNNNNGINTHLAQLARIEKDIQFYSKYATSKVAEDINIISGKLEKIRNRKDESFYGRGDAVGTSILTDADIELAKNKLSNAKKAKQKLQDELLELNVRATIALSDSTVATLTRENII
jgi:hypothetical protein